MTLFPRESATPSLKTEAPGAGAPVVLRAAVAGDAAAVAQLAAEARIDELSDRGRIFVAADGAGHVVGFIRLVDAEGCWYVNPVVVTRSLHRRGIGAALMTFARARFGELRFVARGYAVPFYEALGCEPVGWDAIAPIIAADCDGCEMAPTCNATPMRMA